jgi:hypothetical protein
MTLRILTEQSDRLIAVADSWNDLSLADLYAAYAILMSDAPAFLEPTEVIWAKRLSLFMHFTGSTDADIDAWRSSCMEEHGAEDGHYVFMEEIDEVLSHFSALIEPVETGHARSPSADAEAGALSGVEAGALSGVEARLYQVKLGRTKCPYRIISHKEVGFEWHAPADELENLNIYELGQAFTLFEKYLDSLNEDYIHQLIATLYRPAKPGTQYNIDSDYEGDIRLPYNRHERTVAQRAPYIKMLPELTKQLLLFWFASCRQKIIGDYPNLFTPPEDEPQGERVGNDYGWGGIIMALADNVTQIDQIAEKPFHNVFTYLSFLDDRRKTEEMRALRLRSAPASTR